MIEKIIEWSSRNRFFVFLGTIFAICWGWWSLKNIPLDAIPDLSDVQVIVFTEWPGRSPDIVEDQITYPIVTSMVAAPKVKVARGYSFFGLSFVYIIFEEGTDLYWARSRTLEYMNRVRGQLPDGVNPNLGPDATGVGWVFEYALVDKTGQNDLADLRTFQDWYLRYWLEEIPGVAEVASIGGFVKQYQVQVDPSALLAYNIPMKKLISSIQQSNNDVGGRVIEMAEREFFVRGRGYIKSIEDIENIPVGVTETGTPILVKNVARVNFGPDMRRGAAELDGEGETVGGIVVMRVGENALKVIERVKEKLKDVRNSLPPGVELVTTYDRSDLIHRSIDTLRLKLIEEMLVVSLIIIIFLWHFRSALIPVLTLPVAALFSFIPMFHMGLSSNIMSLGGIAIAIGAMVDAAIIMVENGHKRLEEWESEGRKTEISQVILKAAQEVGRPLFFSLLVIAVSFMPIFILEEQAGRLFKPLAFTKNFSMFFAAVLAITAVPLLMQILLKPVSPIQKGPRWFKIPLNFVWAGKIYSEATHPISRFLIRIYEPVLKIIMDKRRMAIFVSALIVFLSIPLVSGWGPLLMSPLKFPIGTAGTIFNSHSLKKVSDGIQRLSDKIDSIMSFYPKIGSEFMPPLNEGDILYMPTTLPGISIEAARQWLQTQDQLIKSFPEVERVFGKIGRARTPTDPAPLSMVETVGKLKPMKKWPKVHHDRWYSHKAPHWAKTILGIFWPEKKRRTWEKLIADLDTTLQIPGTTNAWTMPIKTRIDMLTTGIRTPVGIKIYGADLKKIQEIGEHIEAVLPRIKGTRSVFAERVTGGYFLDFYVKREEAARYGLTVGDVEDIIETAIGGKNVTMTIEGRERFPVNVRYFRELRSNIDQLKRVLVPTPSGAQVPIQQLADITTTTGPPAIKDENGMLTGWVYVDLTSERDIGSYVKEAKEVIAQEIKLPPGYYLGWSGQFEYMERAKKRLLLVIPFTLLVVFLLIHINTKSIIKTCIVLLAVPFSLVGAFWFLYFLDYNMSIAVWVGLIALAGVDAETGVVMLLYLDIAFNDWVKKGKMKSLGDLEEAVMHGAVQRIRPKMMTVLSTFIGLLPIMWAGAHEAGADVMKRIAAPMVGGIFTSFVMELLIYPAIYIVWKWKYQLKELKLKGE